MFLVSLIIFYGICGALNYSEMANMYCLRMVLRVLQGAMGDCGHFGECLLHSGLRPLQVFAWDLKMGSIGSDENPLDKSGQRNS